MQFVRETGNTVSTSRLPGAQSSGCKDGADLRTVIRKIFCVVKQAGYRWFSDQS